MAWSAVSFAFVAGSVAAVNPCGFVMLPAFAAWVLGGDDSAATPAWLRLWRALRLGAAVTVAFVVVFAVAGFAVDLGGALVAGVSQWLTLLVGVGLAGYGVAVLAGRGAGGLGLPNPAHERAGGSALLFGAGYAVVSLSCTLPVFLSVAGLSLASQGAAAGLVSFAAYALGMGTVVLAVALAVALARDRLVAWLRSASRHVTRASGALLAVVGVYVTGYAVYTLSAGVSTAAPGGGAPAPIAWMTRLSSVASGWLSSPTGQALVGALAAGLGVVAGAVAWRRLRATRGAEPAEEGPREDVAAAVVSADGDGDSDGQGRCCQ